jgi:hypothetical protein
MRFGTASNETDVELRVGFYSDRSLRVSLVTASGEPFMEITMNYAPDSRKAARSKASKRAFFIQYVKNYSENRSVEEFLTLNNIAAPTGACADLTYVSIPEYVFNASRLHELDPSGYERFLAAQRMR